MLRNINFSLKEKNNELVLAIHDTHLVFDIETITNELLQTLPNDIRYVFMAMQMIEELTAAMIDIIPNAKIIPTLLQGPEPTEFTSTSVEKWFLLSLMYQYADASKRDKILDNTSTEVFVPYKKTKQEVVAEAQFNSNTSQTQEKPSNDAIKNTETPNIKQDEKVLMKTIEFVVPKIPHLALNFVFSMFQIITFAERSSEGICITFSNEIENQFSEAIIVENDNEYLTEASLKSFFNKNIIKDLNVNKAFLNLFTAFTSSISDYDAMFAQLKKIDQYWASHPESKQFIEIFNILTRMELLYNKELCTPFIMNRSTVLSERRDTFASIANKVISANEEINQAERDFQLRCLNLLIKKTLFEQCIGRKAHDGGNFGFHYTEWNFLAHADFVLNENDLMQITNIATNPTYKTFYAPTKQNHDVFVEEMKVFFNTLGLTFNNTDNLHNIIEFDQESTKYLKTCGIHWNASHMDELKTKLSNSQASLFRSLFRRVTATQIGFDQEDHCEMIRAVHGQ